MNTPVRKAQATRKLRICAIACLGLLALLIVSQLVSICQTRREWINQQNAVHAIVTAIMFLFAIGIYLLKRYWWTILLVAFTLVANQYLF